MWRPDYNNTCAETHPNAIIRVQRVRDVPTNGFPCGIVAGVPSTLATDYWPTVLYDAREATRRENDNPALLYAAGVMHYVELDVNNLRRWFKGTIGGGSGGGGNTMNTTGYVVYFGSSQPRTRDTPRPLSPQRRDRRARVRGHRQPGESDERATSPHLTPARISTGAARGSPRRTATASLRWPRR